MCGVWNSPAFSARLIDCLRGERSDFQFVLIKLRAINICGEWLITEANVKLWDISVFGSYKWFISVCKPSHWTGSFVSWSWSPPTYAPSCGLSPRSEFPFRNLALQIFFSFACGVKLEVEDDFERKMKVITCYLVRRYLNVHNVTHPSKIPTFKTGYA